LLLIIAWSVVEQWQRLAARQAKAQSRPALYGVWDVEASLSRISRDRRGLALSRRARPSPSPGTSAPRSA